MLRKKLDLANKKRADFISEHLDIIYYKDYQDLIEITSQDETACYLAGSDQIWNPLFKNGWDGAFFLDFAPEGAKRVSYAASFSVEELSKESREFMSERLKKVDTVSVREGSAVKLLNEMGIDGITVLDPVFLLDREHWEGLATAQITEKYLLIYDFDASPELLSFARSIAREKGLKIASLFKTDGADIVLDTHGPREFLGDIMNAECVISNSFHATAFSIIFDKEFYVFRRREGINTRMADLLSAYGLSDRMITDASVVPTATARADLEALTRDTEKSRIFLKSI